MGLKINVFNLIILFGTFQGFLLVFLLNVVRSSKRNFFLSLMIFAFTVNTLKMMAFDIGLFSSIPTLVYIPFLFYLIGPALYFYTRFLVGIKVKSVKEYILHFALLGLNILYYSICFIVNTSDIYEFHTNTFRLYEEFFSLIVVGVYLIFTLYELKKYQIWTRDNFSNLTDYTLVWLKNLCIAYFFGWLIWLIYYVLDISTGYFYSYNGAEAYYPLYIYMSVFIYWIGYSGYFKSEFKSQNRQADSKNKLSFSEKDKKNLKRVTDLVINETLYKNSTLKIDDIASKIDLNSKYVSFLLNSGLEKSFYDYINGLRIEEFKSRLQNSADNILTIQSLAEESGFKSRSTYNDLFKKYESITPKQFKERMQN